MRTTAFIGLGSNMDDPLAHVRRALNDLSRLTQSELTLISPLYRSRPMGGRDQPDYINAVAGLLTSSNPHTLLDALQRIEHDHGRTRTADRWSARTLDLDLLAYADVVIDDDRLTLPHPGAHLRAFVLVPWCEIAPDYRIPKHGSVCDLASRCDARGLVKLDSVP